MTIIIKKYFKREPTKQILICCHKKINIEVIREIQNKLKLNSDYIYFFNLIESWGDFETKSSLDSLIKI